MFPEAGVWGWVAPLNELLLVCWVLPPAVTVNIISILITVHGKNSPNLRNKGFARPSVARRPPAPRPHPLAVFLLFSAKVWQSLMLRSSALSVLWRETQGGKTKKPRCAILHILYHCLAAVTTLICKTAQPAQCKMWNYLKWLKLAKTILLRSPHLRCAEWVVLQEWRLGSVDIVPAKQVSR